MQERSASSLGGMNESTHVLSLFQRHCNEASLRVNLPEASVCENLCEACD